MPLSNEIVSEFVKVTRDYIENKTETTLFGTVVVQDNSKYVRIDGSDLLTPVTLTADVQNNERVTVLIKDHAAIVTGNISSPSARTDDVQEVGNRITEAENDVQEVGNRITEAEKSIADKVSIKDFEEVTARINDKFIAREITSGSGGVDPDVTTEFLCLTNVNTPSGNFMYILTFFYATKSGIANRSQLAIPYNKTGSVYHRFYFDGTWHAWRRHVNEDEVKTVTVTKSESTIDGTILLTISNEDLTNAALTALSNGDEVEY